VTQQNPDFSRKDCLSAPACRDARDADRCEDAQAGQARKDEQGWSVVAPETGQNVPQGNGGPHGNLPALLGVLCVRTATFGFKRISSRHFWNEELSPQGIPCQADARDPPAR